VACWGDMYIIVAHTQENICWLECCCVMLNCISCKRIEGTDYPRQITFVWFQASAAMLMRSAVLWGVMQRWVVILYQHFGTTHQSHFQGSRSPMKGTDLTLVSVMCYLGISWIHPFIAEPLQLCPCSGNVCFILQILQAAYAFHFSVLLSSDISIGRAFFCDNDFSSLLWSPSISLCVSAPSFLPSFSYSYKRKTHKGWWDIHLLIA
jgi:hypothetical protein